MCIRDRYMLSYAVVSKLGCHVFEHAYYAYCHCGCSCMRVVLYIVHDMKECSWEFKLDPWEMVLSLLFMWMSGDGWGGGCRGYHSLPLSSTIIATYMFPVVYPLTCKLKSSIWLATKIIDVVLSKTSLFDETVCLSGGTGKHPLNRECPTQIRTVGKYDILIRNHLLWH